MKNKTKQPTQFGRKILKYIREKDLNQRELGRLWSYDDSSIHNIIYGHRRPSHKKFKDLMRLSKGFFTSDDFFRI